MTEARFPPDDITELLGTWGAGDAEALEQLAPLVYAELRDRAVSLLKGERRDLTLQTQDLVQEAVLRLMDQRNTQWQNRSQFFAVAARMMRRVLVDHCRRKRRARRGGGLKRIQMEELPDTTDEKTSDLIALDQALDDMAVMDTSLARIVELHYFGGLTQEEVAEVVGTSEPTVRRRLRAARAWLYRSMTGEIP